MDVHTTKGEQLDIMEEWQMKKLQSIIAVMIAGLILLAGCNQSNESEEEPLDQNQEGQDEEQSATESNENDQIIGMAETFIDQLNEGKFDEATENFDETMAEQLTADKIEGIWNDLHNQLGDFIDQEFNTVEEVDGYQVVLITGIFNDDEVTFQVTFNENQQIAGFYIQ
ncbi:DUF3887 domain-containing protein [Gracilibacillus thailandensis]|uniref:DUF3887 domain-containing protein n=2 Tax=Gracilibacillus thailandensis TaxID=563735 RepID=A0A6N7R1I5_9BACI|nr:DUF3887 domain-containing protein [Gracilibacillus thailandensis]